MELQRSSVRKSLHWHVTIVKCQSRDFLNELAVMPSVLVPVLFIDPYFIFKFIIFNVLVCSVF